ncbi:MAG TPA: hypothetical protein VE933_09115 [Chitinophagaceae bacterium]|nr:hypothetical protein [Chitinophagaceae bacterium]
MSSGKQRGNSLITDYSLLIVLISFSTMAQSNKKIILLFLIAAAFSLNATAQDLIATKTGPPGTWQELGTVTVKDTVNHDDIVLVGQAEYRSLKFKVQEAPVNILNMNVIYQNGKVDQFNLKYQIPAGGESRVIDLKTDNLKTGVRKIRRVTIWYQTDSLAHTNTAKVTLWGMK